MISKYIKVSHVSDAKLDIKYGSERFKNVGTCFKKGSNFYLQRENDVLHLNTLCINSLHNSIFIQNKEDIFESITSDDFYLNLRNTIFELNIFDFVNTKNS